jgi:hypothetical protein
MLYIQQIGPPGSDPFADGRFGHALKPEKGAVGKLGSALQKFMISNVLGFDPMVTPPPPPHLWRTAA